MGAYTFTDESTVSVAPSRLFKALVIDFNNLVSKLIPDVESIENVEGDGGPGTIKKITFVEMFDIYIETQLMVSGPMKYLRHKIDVIDEQNLVTKYSLIEGDVLADKAESVDYDAKLEGSANGGCTTVTVYHTKGDYVVTEEEHNVHKGRANDIVKAIEAYLLANPSAYA
ncbi:Pathogenesis-related protein STH-21 [Capsicum annuum]|uniref:Pathogenesis-related protein STH-21 n=1 Tax=Capsicum annuum TaxID=4072 RepID=A0A2G2ZUJ1_CAPAN|nr:Pathogenesis-related protein STH-21 [Capsicum annuum]PHT85647.1 Pathogenesis-related protein STH-21 [Capsicum annuum]